MKNDSQLINFFVAGLVYADLVFAQKNARAGQKLSLIREPENRCDQNAILVFLKGRKIGYVPRDLTHIFRDRPERKITRAVVHSYAPSNPTERMVLVMVYAKNTSHNSSLTIC